MSSIIDAVIAALNPLRSVDAAGGSGLFAAPESYKVVDAEFAARQPRNIRAKPVLRDADSMVAYLNRFATENTVMFADWESHQIAAVIDYHSAGSIEPSHCGHKPTLQVKTSEAFDFWSSGQPMSQTDFGRALEGRVEEIQDPDQATIMEMVMTFEVTKRVKFSSSRRLHNGERQFSYVEKDESKGAMVIPEQMTLNIPVLDGMDPQQITAMLRYRIDREGVLTFRTEIPGAQTIERQAFEACVNRVAAGSKRDIPIYSASKPA